MLSYHVDRMAEWNVPHTAHQFTGESGLLLRHSFTHLRYIVADLPRNDKTMGFLEISQPSVRSDSALYHHETAPWVTNLHSLPASADSPVH
jgi:hypothetical protein